MDIKVVTCVVLVLVSMSDVSGIEKRSLYGAGSFAGASSFSSANAGAGPFGGFGPYPSPFIGGRFGGNEINGVPSSRDYGFGFNPFFNQHNDFMERIQMRNREMQDRIQSRNREMQDRIQSRNREMQERIQAQIRDQQSQFNNIPFDSAGINDGSGWAFGSASAGNQGSNQFGAIGPVAPGIKSRFSETLPSSGGTLFGAFASSSTSSMTGPDGIPIVKKSSVTGINDNGKVSVQEVHYP